MPRTYTREEADEILRRALQAEHGDRVSHEDLVAAAREVGIPEQAIEAAALDLAEKREILDRVALLRRRKRAAFLRHLLIFVIINAVLFMISRGMGAAPLHRVALLLWTAVLGILGVVQLAPDPHKLVKRAEHELEAERRREAKRQRRSARGERGSSSHVSAEFEAAVEEGVSTLLGVAAGAIRGLSRKGSRYRVHEPADPARTSADSPPNSTGTSADRKTASRP